MQLYAYYIYFTKFLLHMTYTFIFYKRGTTDSLPINKITTFVGSVYFWSNIFQ